MEDQVTVTGDVTMASDVGTPKTRKFTIVIRGTADGTATKRRITREVSDSIILSPDGVIVLGFEEPEIIVRRS